MNNEVIFLIPYFNDKKRINITLKKIYDWKIRNNISFAVYIIDDGSDKDNKLNLKEIYIQNNFYYIEKQHGGMMDTLIHGFKLIKAKNYVIISSDMPVHINNFIKMQKYLNKFDIIQGSRLKKEKYGKKKIIKRTLDRVFLTIILSKLNRLLYNHEVKDTQIDFKIINAKIIQNVIPDLKLKHDGMKMTEIIIRSYAYGYNILEMETEYLDENKSVTLAFSLKKLHVYLKFIYKAFIAYFSLYFIMMKDSKSEKIVNNPIKKYI